MNSYQRVQAAIKKLEVDRVPKGELLIEQKFILDYMSRLAEDKRNPQNLEEDIELRIDFYHRLGMDLVCLHGNNDQRLYNIQRLAEEGFFVMAVLDGAFQTALNNFGLVNLFSEIARASGQAAGLLQKLSRDVVLEIKKFCGEGIHGLIIADDVAYNQGTYVSPAFIANSLLPCWREQVSAAKECGLPVFFHSDGNINALLPMLIETGFDGLQCIEEAAGMDIKEIKNKFGQDLCLMGNIDPSLLSDSEVFGRDEQDNGKYPRLTSAVENLISVAAPGGGFIFGTSSGLYAGLSPEKVCYMYKLLEKIC